MSTLWDKIARLLPGHDRDDVKDIPLVEDCIESSSGEKSTRPTT